jgi:hypothetical protein
MTKPTPAPGSAGEPVQIDERLWQKWIWKGRELDKAGARNRLRFFQVLLALSVAGVLLQIVLK